MVALTSFVHHHNQSHKQIVHRFNGKLSASSSVSVGYNSDAENVVQVSKLSGGDVSYFSNRFRST